MKPTVGRAVHFYGRQTLWQTISEQGRTVPHSYVAAGDDCDDRHSDLAKYNGFHGPFHATIVFVHEDGAVNLNVSHPVPASRGYDSHHVTSEIVSGVPFSEEPKDEHWTWPPRA